MLYHVLLLIVTIFILNVLGVFIWMLRRLYKRQAKLSNDMAEHQVRQQNIAQKRAELRKQVEALMAKNGKHDE